ncbi:hypothetical protein L218DRAFT_981968 [Marasmius fiardii PR-910]|nr:hypothetical protein L218DRAFT_981968 [Marasmius fiardii PR-910]
MAQPVYDEHPLEQYLKDVGETSSMMPGGLEDDQEGTLEKLLHGFLEPVISAFASQSFNAFVERFKYNVISSSLLSSTLTTSHGHSRSSSIETNQQQHSHSLTSQYSTFSLAIALLIILIGTGYYLSSLSLGAFLLYIFTTDVTTPSLDTLDDLISAGNVWDSVVQEVMTTLEQDEKRMTYSSSAPTSPRSSLRVTLHSTLLTTQNQCDNVRQVLSALTSQTELSQLSHMYAPPSPPPPTKNSFLSTTSSTTSSSHFLSLTNRRRSASNPNLRHGKKDNKRATWNGSYASLANAGSPTMQILKRREKRRSDLSALLQLPSTSPSSPKWASAPVTPHDDSSSIALEGVAEEENVVPEESSSGSSDSETSDVEDGGEQQQQQEEQFGFAALELQRRRKLGGLRVLSGGGSSPQRDVRTPSNTGKSSPRSPSARHLQPLLSPQFSSSVGASSGSRFTTVTSGPRHPLSLSALRVALANAIASKRYACSHLLALRFEEEREDEGYWEDVKSVMGLLTTTLADASGRLMEALEEVERERLRDEVPSPPVRSRELDGSVSDREGEGLGLGLDSGLGKRGHRQTVSFRSSLAFGSSFSSSSLSSIGMGIGFAPMPSHVARFAAHVDAISSALNDAREQLEECVASLREGGEEGFDSRRRRRVGSPSHEYGDVDHDDDDDDLHHQESEQHPALGAYERLRRELGLALRECERGRERLLEVVSPTRNHHHHHLSDEEEEEEEVPGLGHDIRSDESDGKPDSMENEHTSSHHHPSHDVFTVVNPSEVDDVTSHLLITSTSEHLPPPGIEQVYEASSGSLGVFKRERSKMSREERIAMVKKARESGRRLSEFLVPVEEGGGDPLSPLGRSGGVDKWGPGGEVVQELKDVIWKVSEKRRKLGGDDGSGLTNSCSQSAPPILRAG